MCDESVHRPMEAHRSSRRILPNHLRRNGRRARIELTLFQRDCLEAVARRELDDPYRLTDAGCALHLQRAERVADSCGIGAGHAGADGATARGDG
ncbi:hypothetical protein CP556_03925 [Natrinema sp. CBA1119]|nr:hypothetical protein CP556_03925 [Natrinema sp. CBA1119]